MDLPNENTLYALLGALGGFLGGLLSKLLLLVIPGYSQLLDQAKLDRATISELQAENERLREERDGLEDALRDTADSTREHEPEGGLRGL